MNALLGGAPSRAVPGGYAGGCLGNCCCRARPDDPHDVKGTGPWLELVVYSKTKQVGRDSRWTIELINDKSRLPWLPKAIESYRLIRMFDDVIPLSANGRDPELGEPAAAIRFARLKTSVTSHFVNSVIWASPIDCKPNDPYVHYIWMCKILERLVESIELCEAAQGVRIFWKQLNDIDNEDSKVFITKFDKAFEKLHKEIQKAVNKDGLEPINKHRSKSDNPSYIHVDATTYLTEKHGPIPDIMKDT